MATKRKQMMPRQLKNRLWKSYIRVHHTEENKYDKFI